MRIESRRNSGGMDAMEDLHVLRPCQRVNMVQIPVHRRSDMPLSSQTPDANQDTIGEWAKIIKNTNVRKLSNNSADIK
jgi:hypothetical protein